MDHDVSGPVEPGTGWPGDPATADTPVAGSPDDVAGLAASARGLGELDARVSVCRACPRLVAWREEVAATKRRAFAGQPYWGRPAPGFGDPAAGLLVVGLAPAAHGANRTGRVFTGDRSGDWLYAALHRAGYASRPASVHAGDGLALAGARIVAAVRCAPPGNAPAPAERAACAPWLRREIDLLTPTLTAILPLGGIAWQATFAALGALGWTVPRPRPAFGHGAEAAVTTPSGRAVAVVGSYHVSQQNTFTGRLTEAMLDDVLARCRAAGSTPEGLFAGFPDTLALYRAVSRAVADLGAATVRVTRSQVAFRRRKGFAYVWRPGQYVNSDVPAVLSIALPHELVSDRFKSVVQPSPTVWMHHLELRDAAQLDAEVRGWLAEAHRLAG